ncbi:hypothetical protein G7K_3082-t1 [Saitoella complicata NRRL Y-17804]|uniref:AAA+ ATPase domain-containing protein n=1 Tax=Saitoella complicata (strain BCRC 22490 / CBS 7301 / JCM 7358 / NBRC 10748 / NRRL Y-17804) TaxID=698492 RepID=A0A0E9NHP8_SAICN|nr:hypothetical protein G7K_3082-t1 [Saitoella complicata NRRL Y-17804]
MYTDEMEAMDEVHQETIAKKTQQGIVIQHNMRSPPHFSSSQPPFSPSQRLARQNAAQNALNSLHLPSSPPSQLLEEESQSQSLGVNRCDPSAYDYDDDEEEMEIGGSPTRSRTMGPPTVLAKALNEASDKEINTPPAAKFSFDNPSLGRLASIQSHDDLPGVHLPKHDHLRPPPPGMLHVKGFTSNGTPLWFPKKAPKPPRTRRMDMPDGASYGLDRINKLLDELETEDLLLAQQESLQQMEQDVNDADEIDIVKRNTLWTDKYRPQKFTDLLGDERTHRDLLRWLKHWDFCVFGKGNPESTLKSFKSDSSFGGGGSDFTPAPDVYKRPEQRIIMLTGPPGYGKTTLAHIAAKQCGYEVIEINASDDRTGAAVRNKVGNALDTHSITGSGKPACIIIDEIDGVSGQGGEQSFIKALLDFVTADEQASLGARKRKKKKTTKPLLRPIICICNDQFAPALRPLRQYAQILRFKKLPTTSIVNRLKQICTKEGLQADLNALGLLCERTEGDMRSCMNALQFVRMKGDKLTVDTVSNSSGVIGQKDVGKSSWSVVESIFRVLHAKEERVKFNTGISTGHGKRFVGRLVEEVMTNGEYDKVMMGCFTAYPTQPYHDNLLSKPCQASDWLFFHDSIQRGIFDRQLGELGHYSPYAPVAFHHLFGTIKRHVPVERSNADWDAHQKTLQNREILDTLMSHTTPTLRQIFRGSETFVLELASFLIRIISPDLKPVNSQLVKSGEREMLKRVVEAMIGFEMKYVQYKTEEGLLIYRLEPPLEGAVMFEGGVSQKVLPQRYAIRQMIAQGIERVRLQRRKTEVLGITPEEPTSSTKKGEVGAAGGKEAVKKDFFGRVIVPKTEEENEGEGAEKKKRKWEAEKPRVWVKYHDGYSNAVRKLITLNELLS